jgi:predicted ATPase
VIVSRAAELGRLDDLLAALIRGQGGALIVHGEAGIGKTTLLEALVERSDDAVTVVRACGAETEAQLAFSALADLLAPVLGQLDALPVQQVLVDELAGTDRVGRVGDNGREPCAEFGAQILQPGPVA